MAEAVGVEPTRADLESAVLTVRPRLENETTARHVSFLQPKKQNVNLLFVSKVSLTIYFKYLLLQLYYITKISYCQVVKLHF